MKRLFALFLVMLVLMPIHSLAETFSVTFENGEWNMSFEQADECKYIVEGSGTQILDPIPLYSDLSRFVVMADGKFGVTFNSWNHDSNGHSYANYVDASRDVSQVMIETKADWKIECSPIKEMDSPYTSGMGSYITDYFRATPPMIVTVTVECDGMLGGSGISLRQYGIDKEGKVHVVDDLIENEYIYGTESYDVIIKQGLWESEFYFFAFDCAANAKWSITAK